MEFFVALIVVLATLAALAYPLYRARSGTELASASTLDEVMAARDGVYAMLRDLDLDHALGKLNDHDYAVLRDKYMTRAVNLLRELDALRGVGATADASAEIEREVAALRRTPTVPSAKGMICGNCGQAYDEGDKFCSRCGRKLAA